MSASKSTILILTEHILDGLPYDFVQVLMFPIGLSLLTVVFSDFSNLSVYLKTLLILTAASHSCCYWSGPLWCSELGFNFPFLFYSIHGGDSCWLWLQWMSPDQGVSARMPDILGESGDALSNFIYGDGFRCKHLVRMGSRNSTHKGRNGKMHRNPQTWVCVAVLLCPLDVCIACKCFSLVTGSACR